MRRHSRTAGATKLAHLKRFIYDCHIGLWFVVGQRAKLGDQLARNTAGRGQNKASERRGVQPHNTAPSPAAKSNHAVSMGRVGVPCRGHPSGRYLGPLPRSGRYHMPVHLHAAPENQNQVHSERADTVRARTEQPVSPPSRNVEDALCAESPKYAHGQRRLELRALLGDFIHGLAHAVRRKPFTALDCSSDQPPLHVGIIVVRIPHRVRRVCPARLQVGFTRTRTRKSSIKQASADDAHREGRQRLPSYASVP